MYDDETIAAIATPIGSGGIAILRISGKEALSIASKVTKKSENSIRIRTVYNATLYDNDTPIDTILFFYMKAPKSYTGEDVVELHLHGGPLITQKGLSLLIQHGARLAGPGEFTKRAFLAGKIDLIQAEAIQSTIAAHSESSLIATRKQLEGSLSQHITAISEEIVSVSAVTEAWVDYPEEGLEFMSQKEMCTSLSAIIKKLQSLIDSYYDGAKLDKGLSLVFIGSPNVGKSSLVNALSDTNVAIVTNIKGTTRDVLKQSITIQGVEFVLHDTAGIRHTRDIIEKEGILRSKKAALSADIICFVYDASDIMEESIAALYNETPPNKRLLLANKIDTNTNKKHTVIENALQVSALTGVGIDTVKNELVSFCMKTLPLAESLTITKKRHFEALKKAHEFCINALRGVEEDISPECIAFELKEALNEMYSITGGNVTEAVLSKVFASFCVGK